ncbi:MAG: stage II sporulation protein M [Oscillospiraceae bacterium]|nr:stage II sporulation protein M [Oscillospiraceae bacterium]
MNRRRVVRRHRKNSRIRDIVQTHIEERIKEYFIASVLFIVGVIAGVIFINNSSEYQQNEISYHLDSFVVSLQNDHVINDGALLLDSLANNIGIGILLWFMGMSVIGILAVYLIIVFRGFVLGYTIASAIAFWGTGRGMLFIGTSLFLQTLIFVPVILAISVSGMKLYNSIIKDRRKENIKLEVLRHTVFGAVMLVFLVLSSLIEVHISKNLLILCIEYL